MGKDFAFSMQVAITFEVSKFVASSDKFRIQITCQLSFFVLPACLSDSVSF